MSTRHYLLHLGLLLFTLFTTAAAGSAFDASFQGNRPLSFDDFFPAWTEWSRLSAGIPYALTLLTILLAHEMGHYLMCRFYGIQASLPYFIGVPTLIGTFGAFIRIRSAITTRKELFDVGIAGPIAGFIFVIPALGIGLAYSRVIPGIEQAGDFAFSTPLLLRGLEALVFPGVPHQDIHLHPIARAAWFGVLATALNLLPIGQLDGGHILYSIVGVWHKPLTWLFLLALIPLGIFYSWSWLLWAALLALFARRHPRIYDDTPIGPGRRWLGLLAAAIFVLSFSLTPVRI